MPSQSYKYLGKRMLESYTIANPKSNPLYKRIAMSNGIIDVKIDNLILIKDIYTKYANIQNGEKTRKVGKLMYELLNGRTIKLPKFDDPTIENDYALEIREKIDFIVNGLIYNYRNERFHGNTFSPFKSSKASIATYSHAHYMFL